MSSHRRSWLAACSLIVACVLLSGVNVGAGDKDKKKVEKKKEEAKPLLTKAEELTADDEKDTHPRLNMSPRKVYKFQMAEGKTYQIDLKSKDFDSVLRLEDVTGKQVALNDDYAPPLLDSRIIYRAPKAGEFKIIATNLDGKAGKFTLTVTEAPAGTSASIFKSKAIELKLKDDKASYAGELNQQDGMALMHYYKVFTVKLEAGKAYRIDHKSGDVDAFLFLEDPFGNRLAEDDDSGGGTNARIVHKADTTGVYRIIATTLPARETGKFTLEVSPDDGKEKKETRRIDGVNRPFEAIPVLRREILTAD